MHCRLTEATRPRGRKLQAVIVLAIFLTVVSISVSQRLLEISPSLSALLCKRTVELKMQEVTVYGQGLFFGTTVFSNVLPAC